MRSKCIQDKFVNKQGPDAKPEFLGKDSERRTERVEARGRVLHSTLFKDG